MSSLRVQRYGEDRLNYIKLHNQSSEYKPSPLNDSTVNSLSKNSSLYKSSPSDMTKLFDKDYCIINLKDYCRVWEFYNSEKGVFERHSDFICMSYNIQYQNFLMFR